MKKTVKTILIILLGLCSPEGHADVFFIYSDSIDCNETVGWGAETLEVFIERNKRDIGNVFQVTSPPHNNAGYHQGVAVVGRSAIAKLDEGKKVTKIFLFEGTKDQCFTYAQATASARDLLRKYGSLDE